METFLVLQGLKTTKQNYYEQIQYLSQWWSGRNSGIPKSVLINSKGEWMFVLNFTAICQDDSLKKHRGIHTVIWLHRQVKVCEVVDWPPQQPGVMINNSSAMQRRDFILFTYWKYEVCVHNTKKKSRREKSLNQTGYGLKILFIFKHSVLI